MIPELEHYDRFEVDPHSLTLLTAYGDRALYHMTIGRLWFFFHIDWSEKRFKDLIVDGEFEGFAHYAVINRDKQFYSNSWRPGQRCHTVQVVDDAHSPTVRFAYFRVPQEMWDNRGALQPKCEYCGPDPLPMGAITHGNLCLRHVQQVMESHPELAEPANQPWDAVTQAFARCEVAEELGWAEHFKIPLGRDEDEDGVLIWNGWHSGCSPIYLTDDSTIGNDPPEMYHAPYNKEYPG